MITNEISNSLKQAYREYLDAENELKRPHEDVVTLSACQSVRSSMKHIMELYLSAHAIPFDKNPSLSSLLEQCMKTSKEFSIVDFSNIECKGTDHAHCDGKYCLSIENVACCIDAANKLQNIVWTELEIV